MAVEVADDAPVADERTYGRIVWDLAWPAIALNSLQVVNSLLDAKFVASLGKDSLNASGAAQSFIFLLISLAFALGTGATALVSRFYGAGERADMVTASRQATWLSLIVGFGFAGLGALALPHVAVLFVDRGGPAYHEVLRYVYPILLGIPAQYIFMVLAANLRAIGDTKTPMVVSGFQILLHMGLNVLLIFPPHKIAGISVPGFNMGIAGAGTAYAISCWVAALLYFPASGRTILGQSWKLGKISKEWILRILKIAIPTSVLTIIRVTSFAAFAMALKHTAEGESALGAMRVGIAMEAIAFMPAFGYMVAASALVGQSLGARNPERAERLGWTATHQAVALMTVMSVLFLLFAPQIASVFVQEPTQHLVATRYLQIVGITEPLFGYAMVLTGAHQGAGDTVRPTWAALFSSWLLRVPCVWLFAVVLGGGSIAAWWVMSATQAANGLIMIAFFKQGRWKTKEV